MQKNKYGDFILYLVHGNVLEAITNTHPIWGKARVHEPFMFQDQRAILFEDIEDAFRELRARVDKTRSEDYE